MILEGKAAADAIAIADKITAEADRANAIAQAKAAKADALVASYETGDVVWIPSGYYQGKHECAVVTYVDMAVNPASYTLWIKRTGGYVISDTSEITPCLLSNRQLSQLDLKRKHNQCQ